MTESEKINRVFDSTSSYIHFPFNYVTAQYETAQYRAHMTEDEYSSEEVHHTIEVIHSYFAEVNLAGSLKLLKFTIGSGLLIFTVLRLLAFLDYCFGFIPIIDYLHMGFGALLFVMFFITLTIFCIKASKVSARAQAFLEEETKAVEKRRWKWHMAGVFSLNITKDQIVKERNLFFFDGPESNDDVVVLSFNPADDFFLPREDINTLTNGHCEQHHLDSLNEEIKKIVVESKLATLRSFLDNFLVILILLITISAGLGIMSLCDPGSPLLSYSMHTFYAEQVLFLIYAFITFSFQYHKSQKVRKDVIEIIEKHNKNIEKKGIRWYLPSFFPYWIELWRDYTIPFRPSRKHQNLSPKHSKGQDLEIAKPLEQPLIKKPKKGVKFAEPLDS